MLSTHNCTPSIVYSIHVILSFGYLVFIHVETFQQRRDDNSIKTKLVQAMKDAENKSEVSFVYDNNKLI